MRVREPSLFRERSDEVEGSNWREEFANKSRPANAPARPTLPMRSKSTRGVLARAAWTKRGRRASVGRVRRRDLHAMVRRHSACWGGVYCTEWWKGRKPSARSLASLLTRGGGVSLGRSPRDINDPTSAYVSRVRSFYGFHRTRHQLEPRAVYGPNFSALRKLRSAYKQRRTQRRNSSFQCIFTTTRRPAYPAGGAPPSQCT